MAAASRLVRWRVAGHRADRAERDRLVPVVGNVADLANVSVGSAPDRSVEELAVTFRNKQVGVTTAGKVRAKGATPGHRQILSGALATTC